MIDMILTHVVEVVEVVVVGLATRIGVLLSVSAQKIHAVCLIRLTL